MELRFRKDVWIYMRGGFVRVKDEEENIIILGYWFLLLCYSFIIIYGNSF